MATLAVATRARSAVVTVATNVSYLLYLLRKALRRLVWAWPAAPGPGDNAALHLRWLNAVLTARGLQSGGSQVVAAALIPLSENPWGMIGSIKRFRLTYNGVGVPGPPSVVLKVRGVGTGLHTQFAQRPQTTVPDLPVAQSRHPSRTGLPPTLIVHDCKIPPC